MTKQLARIQDLRPQARNANKHTPRGLGALERSIQADGWIGAITTAANGESFDGSARIEVGASAGFDDAIVIRSDGSRPIVHVREDIPTADDPRAKRLGVAANRIAQLDYDPDAQLLAELAGEVDLSPYYTRDELAALLAQVQTEAQPEDDAGEIVEQGPTRCQLGDVWRVGEHIVACLDSTEPGNLDRVVQGAVAMVWADPPYGIDIVTADGYVGGGEKYDYPFGGVKRLGSTNGAKPFGKVGRISQGMKAKPIIEQGRYEPVIGDDTSATAERSSALCLAQYPRATHFWWGANNYAHMLPPSTCWIVWDKDNGESFFADAELAWSNHKSAVRIFKHMWNGLMKASERGERRVHPTQKPVALCLWAFDKYGSAGDIILDPFLGSGPSLKAAHRMGDGRRVIGFELSPYYVDHVIAWAEAEGLTCERATYRAE